MVLLTALVIAAVLVYAIGGPIAPAVVYLGFGTLFADAVASLFGCGLQQPMVVINLVPVVLLGALGPDVRSVCLRTIAALPTGTPALSERLLDEPAPAGAPSPPQRVELLDNAKAILILCVVCYHTAVVYSTADRPEAPIPVASGLLALMKAVVMPCFCLISGHLSPSSYDERRVRALFQLFVTFLIFQLLNYLNLMMSYRINDFDFPTWPVQLFHPKTPVYVVPTARTHAHTRACARHARVHTQAHDRSCVCRAR